jgi:hypothetical protein
LIPIVDIQDKLDALKTKTGTGIPIQFWLEGLASIYGGNAFPFDWRIQTGDLTWKAMGSDDKLVSQSVSRIRMG